MITGPNIKCALQNLHMKTPDLPPIEYKPTFGLDSRGLVVTKATQEEWECAVKAFKDSQPRVVEIPNPMETAK